MIGDSLLQVDRDSEELERAAYEAAVDETDRRYRNRQRALHDRGGPLDPGAYGRSFEGLRLASVFRPERAP